MVNFTRKTDNLEVIMKKRDLTKLALMGIAIGLCGGHVEADDSCSIQMDEQMYAAGCGPERCSGDGKPKPKPPTEQNNGEQAFKNGQYKSRQTAESSNEAWMDQGCKTVKPNGQKPVPPQNQPQNTQK